MSRKMDATETHHITTIISQFQTQTNITSLLSFVGPRLYTDA